MRYKWCYDTQDSPSESWFCTCFKLAELFRDDKSKNFMRDCL